jgi:peptidoglycan L-alanyl-D-glutamate endopeptidase CwlK
MYALGKKSLQRLKGVHPDLVAIVKRAITLTEQDFTVLEGVRSAEQAAANLASGASQTNKSRHLVGPDGYGHAVDLAAWQDNTVSWEWDRYLPIADAMRRAGQELGYPIRYGGGWYTLTTLNSPEAIKRATDTYAALRRAQKQQPFLDGGHFELPRGHAYP